MKRILDTLAMSIAKKLPRSVAYWCTIRVGLEAVQGSYSRQSMSKLLIVDALQRWKQTNGQ